MNFFSRSKGNKPKDTGVNGASAGGAVGASSMATPRVPVLDDISSTAANNDSDLPFDLFKNNEYPMLFYMPLLDPDRSRCTSIIERCGGVLVVTPPTSQASNVIYLSSGPVSDYLPAYSTRFVDDSVKALRVVPLENYRIDTVYTEEVSTPKRKSKKAANTDGKRQKVSAATDPNLSGLGAGGSIFNAASGLYGALAGRKDAEETSEEEAEEGAKGGKTLRFSPEQDQFILNQVRLNPVERGSHSFFKDLSQYEILSPHNAVSIRSRYRLHLMPKLKWGYKTDKDGNLVYDSNGDKIKVPVEDLPVRKQKFTAEDDYLMCLKIMEEVKSNLPEQELKYEQQIKDFRKSRIPDSPRVPVSFFRYTMRSFEQHTYESWRYRYSKVASKVGVQSYIHYYESALKQRQKPYPMIHFVGSKPSDEGIGSLVGSSYNDKVNVPLDEEISQVKDSNIQYLSSQNALSTPAAKRSPRKKVDKSPAKTPSKANKSVDPVIPVLDEIEDSEEDEPPKANETPDSSADYNITETQIDRGIKYVPKNRRQFDKLFKVEFFLHDKEELKHRLNKVYKKLLNKGLPEVYDRFKKLGMKSLFISHLIMSTNGDLFSIRRFNELLLDGLNSQDDLVDKLPELLTVYGVSGIWNEEYDDYLKQEHYFGRPSPQLSCQTPEAIKQRIEFLKELDDW